MLASCSDGGSDSSDNPNPTPLPEEIASITCSTTSLSLGYEGGEKTLSFTVNKNWTISYASGISWCTISQTAGSAGTFNVSIKVSENQEYDDRNVTIIIKCDNAAHNVVLTQKQKNALLITTNKYEVEQKGGTIEVEVKANIDYQVQIAEAASSWIKEAVSRGLSSHKHSFVIAESEEYDKRVGEIHFLSGNQVETVKVYQTGGAILMLSKNEYAVDDTGDTISVEIKSNVEYGVQIPDVAWITEVTSSRGMSSHTLKYVIATNETYDSRSVEITIYDKNSDLKDTLKVVQAQKDAIIISKKDYEVTSEGDIIEVRLSANIDFEIIIPEVDWIKQVKSRALTDHILYFKVLKNTNEDDRKAEIVIINKESQLSESIILYQIGFKGSYVNGVATITKSGTLKEVLGKDYMDITFLKVIGNINGTDIQILREMAGSDVEGNDTKGQLQILDISKCNIVEGGNTYILSKYTANNTVGSNMFQNCSSLKELYLPETITKIEDYALANCTQLKVFDIPKNVSTLGNNIFQGCSSLEELVIPSNINSWNMLGKTSIKSIKIENGVKYIPYQAFRQCLNLIKITIPKTVTRIGSGAFHYPNDMKEVYVDDLEQWLNYNWNYVDFYGCDYPLTGENGILYIGEEKIRDVIIPDTYKSIYQYAFYGCTNIEKITLPNTLERIGNGAFSKTNIHEIKIPNSVKEIGEYTFAHCKNLEKVKVSNLMTTIPEGCFSNCKKLKFSIPNNIQEIKLDAFYKCESLEEITIPHGMTSIGSSAFTYCINVKTITLPATLKSINASTFGGIPVDVVYCYADNPPFLPNYSHGGEMNFNCVNNDTGILYVPKDSKQVYKESDWGNLFTNITEIE